MGLLERVQKKAGGEEVVRPAVGRLAAAPEATEVATTDTPLTPAAPAPTPVDTRPPLAPIRTGQQSRGQTPASRAEAAIGPKPTPAQAQFAKIKSRVHSRLVEEMQDEDTAEREDIVAKIGELVNEVLAISGTPLPRNERARLVESLINDVLGLGPLEQLLNDPAITEIMINGPRQIYIEMAGRLTLSSVAFESTGQLLQVIDRVVSSIGRRVDESSPMVDARLKDGSRVNVIIPPLALTGPTMTIRKFAACRSYPSIDDLIRFKSITAGDGGVHSRLRARQAQHLVSGGTGSGKTTTLKRLPNLISEDERIITIEDAAELQLQPGPRRPRSSRVRRT